MPLAKLAKEVRTPAQVAGIEVKGENKWMTLIQNAGCKARRGLDS